MDSSNKILDSDIKYSDSKVTILHPHIKKGVLIVTFFELPDSGENLRETGLKSGKQLKQEGIEFRRSKIHPYIFFKAPMYSTPPDQKSTKCELVQNYGSIFGEYAHMFPNFIAIRVDPDRTKVYSSEIRTQHFDNDTSTSIEEELKKCEKSLSEYLKIIQENDKITNSYQTHNIYYNLISSKKVKFLKPCKAKYPFNTAPIERNSEILVEIPHLTSDYFVKC